MSDGEISEIGTYNDLIDTKGGGFSQFISDHEIQKKEEIPSIDGEPM